MARPLAKTGLLVLLLLIAAPPLHAAEPAAPAPWGFLGDLWNLLANAWGDNGCEVDPSGRCAPRQAPATIDNGCGVDPSGSCAAAASDNGCGVDPDGRCHG